MWMAFLEFMVTSVQICWIVSLQATHHKLVQAKFIQRRSPFEIIQALRINLIDCGIIQFTDDDIFTGILFVRIERRANM